MLRPTVYLRDEEREGNQDSLPLYGRAFICARVPWRTRSGSTPGVEQEENMKRLFTSESVTEGHPDKMCDQISDAILDAILEKDPNGRVACETTATTGYAMVMGEISTNCYVDIPKIVRKCYPDIGYDRAKYGFDADTCAV